jgi:hypothetical protein
MAVAVEETAGSENNGGGSGDTAIETGENLECVADDCGVKVGDAAEMLAPVEEEADEVDAVMSESSQQIFSALSHLPASSLGVSQLTNSHHIRALSLPPSIPPSLFQVIVDLLVLFLLKTSSYMCMPLQLPVAQVNRDKLAELSPEDFDRVLQSMWKRRQAELQEAMDHIVDEADLMRQLIENLVKTFEDDFEEKVDILVKM